MLDFFSIFSRGGLLLWCFRNVDIDIHSNNGSSDFRPAINAFIRTILLQEMTSRSTLFEVGPLALKAKLDNEFELVYVAGFQKMLPLLYLDKLLDEIQIKFRDKYRNELKESNFFRSVFDFSSEFNVTLIEVQKESSKESSKKKMRTFQQSDKSKKTIGSMIESNNNQPDSKRKEEKKTPKAEKKSSPKLEPSVAELDEATRQANLAAMRNKFDSSKKKKEVKKSETKKGKADTKWDAFTFGGKGATGEEARSLERGPKDNKEASEDIDHQLRQFVPDASVVGRSAQIKDLDEDYSSSSDEEDDNDEQSNNNKSQGSSFWSSLTSLVGNKSLSMADIEPVLAKMKEHLIAKNVAADVAEKLCESVAANLEGKVIGTFSTIHRTVKATLTTSLVKLLTPKRRVDILRDVVEARRNKKPYVMTFCGVNGVGKSTNLAKICFWLLENNFRVLIAACDTFRAGAVEQLRTHCRRLNNLHPPKQNQNFSMVELYEKGYGKDAAGIALEAINYARSSGIDVVLVDTAGRMQDNEPLMRALAKLIAVNDPDLVLFVGEALVGNEAVDQLVKFNAALADHSTTSEPHLIDGIVLTKFDTIDDKVGSAISMTYITGQPIVFVGTGQTYTDLKALNSRAVVQALMK